MFLSNLPALTRMAADPRVWRFLREVAARLGEDPAFGVGALWRLIRGVARDERVVAHDGVYVVSSFLPPIPSRAFLQFLDASADRDPRRRFRDFARARRSAPLSVFLKITDRCPYRCVHCSARFAPRETDLDASQWREIIAKLQNMGTAYIGVTGGEPMLRDDMEEIVRGVDDRSTTLLFTSGFGLTRDRAASLRDAGLFALSVSLDSPTPATHNAVRGNPRAFSRGLDAIRHARRAGLYTIVQSVIFQRELDRGNLFRLFQLAEDHGAHEVRLHQPAPAGRLLLDPPGEGVFFTDADRHRLFDIQAEANARWGHALKVASFPHTEGPDKFGCCAGLLHAYITSAGDVTPCDFLPLRFGNALQDDLSAVYRRMSQAMARPRLRCMALDVAGELAQTPLPLDPARSADLCRRTRPGAYPRFFRELQQAGDE